VSVDPHSGFSGCEALCGVSAIFGMCENPHKQCVKQRHHDDSIEHSCSSLQLCQQPALNGLPVTKAVHQTADVGDSQIMCCVSILCHVDFVF